ESPRFFKEGEHLVSFYSRDDMIEKVGFYLEHDTERQRIAKNGHDLVQKLHNYDVRMAEMMEALSRN
ncbi:MAG: glycosyltransferase family 1 protein, partial [Lachnospiraceae bacterium]|nr:glycosyltransferase family 1 protein [Lachnospiraceae bacterium]